MKIKLGNIGQSIQQQIQEAANTVEKTIEDVKKNKNVSFPDVPKEKETGFLPPVPYPSIENPKLFETMLEYQKSQKEVTTEDKEKVLGQIKEKRTEIGDELEKRILESKKLIHKHAAKTTEDLAEQKQKAIEDVDGMI
jgi:hypothetical protein